MAGAPPLLWQNDLASSAPDGRAPREAIQDSNERLSDAWRHVISVGRDVGREADLYDLLASTNRSDTYQLQTSGVS
jgi:hypothetical protein